MKIGEIAKLTGCSVETVRYYERQSLLPKAHRSLNGYRDYDASHEKVLRFIRNCRVLNMSHAEIRTLLRSDRNPSRTCQPINDVLDEHIAHVEVRIKELKELKMTLTEVRRLCSKSGKSKCGIIEGLSRLKMPGDRWNKTHL
jgi:Cd(II)/Pb(II)-responsive transcriptional regulator